MRGTAQVGSIDWAWFRGFLVGFHINTIICLIFSCITLISRHYMAVKIGVLAPSPGAATVFGTQRTTSEMERPVLTTVETVPVPATGIINNPPAISTSTKRNFSIKLKANER